MVKPIFIFSLPRSGSTLVQRILSSSPDISTTSEPWLLLPLFYSVRTQGNFSEYWSARSVEAISDFCDSLPNGMEDYHRAIEKFASGLYEMNADDGAKYFLDKTPRYHLICESILEAFPQAKIIFIWRNPLAIAASINETWANGRWKLGLYKIDLYEGIENLLSASERYKGRVHIMRYEELLTEPDSVCRDVMAYLGLPYDEHMLQGFSENRLSGRMGDPTGTKDYSSLSDAPLAKWKKSMSNPLRKHWARGYLKWIGQDRLAVMGYDMHELQDEIDQIPTDYNFFFSDILYRIRGFFMSLFEPVFLKYKFRSMRNWEKVRTHL